MVIIWNLPNYVTARTPYHISRAGCLESPLYPLPPPALLMPQMNHLSALARTSGHARAQN